VLLEGEGSLRMEGMGLLGREAADGDAGLGHALFAEVEGKGLLSLVCSTREPVVTAACQH